MPAIEVENLTKRFQVAERDPGAWGALRGLVRRRTRDVRALDGVSFRIEPGELVGYIGPNGAGKSTTVKVLVGHPRARRRARARCSAACRGSERIAHVGAHRRGLRPAHAALVGPAGDRVASSCCATSTACRRRDYRRSLRRAGRAARPRRRCSTRRCASSAWASACAATWPPSLLHAPAHPLPRRADHRAGRGLASSRCATSSGGSTASAASTVILTTHDMDDIEALCSRVIVIGEGRILFDGTLDDLRARVTTERRLIVDLADEDGDDQPTPTPTVVSREGGRGRARASIPQRVPAADAHRPHHRPLRRPRPVRREPAHRGDHRRAVRALGGTGGVRTVGEAPHVPGRLPGPSPLCRSATSSRSPASG